MRRTINAFPLMILGLASFLLFALWGYPKEDAAMLFAYSENIAKGLGIVYSPGGERVDGATDMLLAILLGLLRFFGLPVDIGAAALNAVGLSVTLLLVHLAWRDHRVGQLSLGPIAAGALFLSTPVLIYGAMGFGTLFFGGLIAIVAYMSVRATPEVATSRLILLGIAVAVAGMDRIEGFFLGGIIVAAGSLHQRSYRLVLVPGIVASAIAAAWIGWRWSYFGYPLPNAFYKRGGWSPEELPFGFRSSLLYSFPWMWLILLGLLRRTTRRYSAILLGLFALWTFIWVFYSNSMNAGGRFQYPIAPAMAVLSATMAPPLNLQIREWYGIVTHRFGGLFHRLALLSVVAVVATPLLYATRLDVVGMSTLQRAGLHQEVAEALDAIASPDQLIVTSEAGMLAWKTDLQIVDLWGLNEKQIAHNGLLRPEDISALHPDFVFTALVNPNDLGALSEQLLNSGRADSLAAESWSQMNVYLLCFIQRSDLIPIGQWGEDSKQWWVFFAHRDDPRTPQLAKRLRDVAAPDSGEVTVPLPTTGLICPN